MNEYLKMNFVRKIAAQLSENIALDEVFLEKQFFQFKKKLTVFCSKETDLFNCFRTLKHLEACLSFEIDSLIEKKSDIQQIPKPFAVCN